MLGKSETTIDLSKLATELADARRVEGELEAAKKELSARVREIEERIAEACRAIGSEKLEVEVGGLDKTLKAEYKNYFSVKGGKGDSPQRQELLQRLGALGFEKDIELFRNINGNRLNGILSNLPAPTLDGLIAAELLTVHTKPNVRLT